MIKVMFENTTGLPGAPVPETQADKQRQQAESPLRRTPSSH